MPAGTNNIIFIQILRVESLMIYYTLRPAKGASERRANIIIYIPHFPLNLVRCLRGKSVQGMSVGVLRLQSVTGDGYRRVKFLFLSTFSL